MFCAALDGAVRKWQLPFLKSRDGDVVAEFGAQLAVVPIAISLTEINFQSR
jgi:hypothetical protein